MIDYTNNELADAFYNENWQYFKRRFGKLPTCHAEAEMLLMKEPEEKETEEEKEDFGFIVKSVWGVTQ